MVGTDRSREICSSCFSLLQRFLLNARGVYICGTRVWYSCYNTYAYIYIYIYTYGNQVAELHNITTNGRGLHIISFLLFLLLLLLLLLGMYYIEEVGDSGRLCQPRSSESKIFVYFTLEQQC